MRCPTCGLETHGLRCPRCSTLVMQACSGGCLGCTLCTLDEVIPRPKGVLRRLATLGEAVKRPLGRSPHP